MYGVGTPLVTPFELDGDLDGAALRELVAWVEDRGVDFVVPCGSTSEAELLTAAERERVIETVVEAASVPVLAGTGSPGYRETSAATEAAAEAGADAALVVTPFYYDHGADELEAYYRELADEASLPIYLYSVPAYTGVRLAPETVERLADHPNVAGLKDSSGDVGEFVRTVSRTDDADFDPMVGSARVFAQALDAGATGGILALANLLPERVSEVYERHRTDPDGARELNVELVELDRAVIGEYGIPGLKWAMRARAAPGGHPRSPHRPLDESDREELRTIVPEA